MGVLGSAASGGVLGIASSALGGVFKYFQTKQAQAFKEKEWAQELRLQELELRRNREEDEHELDLIKDRGSWGGLSESIRADAAPADTYRWSKTVKELYRPFFTTGLFVLVWFVYRDLMNLIGGAEAGLDMVFSPGEAKELVGYITHSIVFTAATAGMWWFGDRAFAPPGMKNR
jgi:hypothetical protein